MAGLLGNFIDMIGLQNSVGSNGLLGGLFNDDVQARMMAVGGNEQLAALMMQQKLQRDAMQQAAPLWSQINGGGQDAPKSGTPNYANAIAGIESGGRYDAVGPETGKGRAYGKYQVMDFNIGPWTQEVLGKSLTPQQFLADKDAQDKVFQTKFGQLAQKHGPEGAARAWFAGEGGMNNPNAKDVNGTTVSGYAQKFNGAMGGPQLASASPTQVPLGTTEAPQEPMAQAQQQPVIPSGLSPKALGLMRMLQIPNLPQAQQKLAETLLQQEIARSEDIREYEYAVKQGFKGSLEQWIQRKRSGAGEYGLQPIWGTDPNTGKPAIIQLGKGGEAIRTKIPDGIEVGKDGIKVDAGTHTVILDPVTRQPISTISKNIEARQEAEKVGDARGTAKVALPAAETTTKRAIRMLDELEKHPGFGEGVGFIIGRLPALTPKAADFRERVEQVDAMVFGDAVEVMRGLGALTDKEGPKVTAARARLKTAKNEADFRAALKDIREVFNDGIANMRNKAGVSTPSDGWTQVAPNVRIRQVQ